MAESSLSITYQDLLTEVGRFLGYGHDQFKWTPSQQDEVDRYVQAGVRQFYYPPAVQGLEPGHEWSFLNPTAEITTEEGEGSQDLPDDFSRILGNLHYDAEIHAVPVVIVSQGRIMALLQQNKDRSRPRCAAVRSKDSNGSDGQRQEIVWWPIPAAALTLSYRYEAYSGKLTETKPYPLGGMKHSGLIIESCLAIAEQYANDERGAHSERFTAQLVASVAQDRKTGARYFGAMGETIEVGIAPRRPVGSSYPISYKGEEW